MCGVPAYIIAVIARSIAVRATLIVVLNLPRFMSPLLHIIKYGDPKYIIT
jgi:hypothetical protein